MAGIAAPAADAASYVETTDYSNNPSSPTVLGPFNPSLDDSIIGSVKNPDPSDWIQVTAAPASTVQLHLSLYNPDLSPSLQFSIYDNPNFGGLISTTFYSGTPTDGGTINFVVPADGNYVMQLATEGGGYSYTIGAVPEPGTTLLLVAGLGVAALARKRKKTSPKT